MINGGCCNTIAGNIIDLGPSGTQHVSAWSSPGGGGALRFSWTGPNVFRNNIVIAHYAGPTRTALCHPGAGVAYCQGPGYPAAFAVIRNNLYHNYAGGAETTTGAVAGDGNPIHRDPEIFGWTYRLAKNSPAYRLIDFPRLAEGWGPPGFRLPETGTPPSNPH